MNYTWYWKNLQCKGKITYKIWFDQLDLELVKVILPLKLGNEKKGYNFFSI